MTWLGWIVTVLVIAPAIARADDVPTTPPEEPALAPVAAPVDVPPPAPRPRSLAADSRAAARAGHCERARGLAARVREEEPPHYDALVADLVAIGCLTLPPIEVAVAAPRPPLDQRSPATAVALSLAPAVVGVGLVAASFAAFDRHEELGSGLAIAGIVAFVVGPTLGHIYVGKAWTAGLRVKLVGAGVAALGIAIAAVPSRAEGNQLLSDSEALGVLMFVGGGVTAITGSIIEISRAHGAAEAHNRGGGPEVTFAPIRTPHGTAPGLVLSGAF